jgi:hypothetical protein
MINVDLFMGGISVEKIVFFPIVKHENAWIMEKYWIGGWVKMVNK